MNNLPQKAAARCYEIFKDMVFTNLVAKFIRDERYKCYCGEPPYTDGKMCPLCDLVYLEEFNGNFLSSPRGVGESPRITRLRGNK